MRCNLYIMLCASAILVSNSVAAKDAITSLVLVSTQMISNGDSASPDAVSESAIIEGEKLYKRRCGGCHSLDSNRIGPRHRGVYGRKAGTVPDYKYSKALRNLDAVWRDDTLDKWLTNPTAYAKGTSMGFRLPKAAERHTIIQYLKLLSAHPRTSSHSE